jgi:hypothetical protein
LLTSEIIGDSIRLLFTKAGSFGVVYEFIIEPGGKVRRVVQGVKSVPGKPLVRKAEFLTQQESDCDDIKLISDDFSQMGSKATFTEIMTPEESYNEDLFIQLTDEMQGLYLERVFDGNHKLGSMVINKVESGMSISDAMLVAEAEIRSGVQHGATMEAAKSMAAPIPKSEEG